MNKYQVYRELRDELTGAYERELQNVREILDTGVAEIAGGRVTLQCSEHASVVQLGEAGKIFRDEIGDSLRLILERYERNLSKESASLGLGSRRPTQATTPPSRAKAVDAPSGATAGNGAGNGSGKSASSTAVASAFGDWSEAQ